MKVLIIGGQFHNKGAYLMVVTVIRKLRSLIEDCEIVMSNYLPLPAELAKEDIKLLKKPLVHVGYEHKQLKRYLQLAPLVNVYKGFPKGDVALEDIDVVIDIAGFAYGDLWGINPVKNLNYVLSEVMPKEVTYICLPQAFGPFEKDGMRSEMAKVIARADLIFARDKVSRAHLTEIAGEHSEKIKQAPDITLSFNDGNLNGNTTENYCCIVPNERMLDKGDASWQDHYLDLLEQIVKQVGNTDTLVKLLVHDSTSGDGKLAKALHERVASDYCQLIEVQDPLSIKKLIAKGKFLIGSRFHSLASALSCNVPSLAMGWSHKYQMLFEEYGQAGYAFDKPEKTAILEKAAKLQDEQTNKQIRQELASKNEVISEKNQQMWQAVVEEVNKKISQVV